MTTITMKNFNPDHDEQVCFDVERGGQCVLRVKFEFNLVHDKITTTPVLPHRVSIKDQAAIISKCSEIIEGFFVTGVTVASIAEIL